MLPPQPQFRGTEQSRGLLHQPPFCMRGGVRTERLLEPPPGSWTHWCAEANVPPGVSFPTEHTRPSLNRLVLASLEMAVVVGPAAPRRCSDTRLPSPGSVSHGPREGGAGGAEGRSAGGEVHTDIRQPSSRRGRGARARIHAPGRSAPGRKGREAPPAPGLPGLAGALSGTWP